MKGVRRSPPQPPLKPPPPWLQAPVIALHEHFVETRKQVGMGQELRLCSFDHHYLSLGVDNSVILDTPTLVPME
jgi:hypothetical protein